MIIVPEGPLWGGNNEVGMYVCMYVCIDILLCVRGAKYRKGISKFGRSKSKLNPNTAAITE